MDISLSYLLPTTRRSRFAKRFLKTTPTLPEKPLHQRCQRQNRFGWSWNPPKQALPLFLIFARPRPTHLALSQNGVTLLVVKLCPAVGINNKLWKFQSKSQEKNVVIRRRSRELGGVIGKAHGRWEG
jgi:hypothetical protein